MDDVVILSEKDHLPGLMWMAMRYAKATPALSRTVLLGSLRAFMKVV